MNNQDKYRVGVGYRSTIATARSAEIPLICINCFANISRTVKTLKINHENYLI